MLGEINPDWLEAKPNDDLVERDTLQRRADLSKVRDPEFLSFRERRIVSSQIVVHDDNTTIYRAMRDGQQIEWQNKHSSYWQCPCAWAKILRERELKMSEDVRLSGSLQNLTHEEFVALFNMDIDERQAHREEIENALQAMLRYLFCEDKTPVAELRRMAQGSSEEKEQAYKILADRIHINETAKNILSVWIHKDKTIQYDIIDDAKDEEKKRLREHDKKYKVKPEKKPEDKKQIVRKSQEDKMRDTLRSFAPEDVKKDPKALEGWIDKFIVKNRKKD